MEIIVPRYMAPGRYLIDGIVPPSPPSETQAKWRAFLRRYLPTFTGRMPQTQADFAVQGLVNGGMVNAGHGMVDAGIIRAHVAGGIPSLQTANWYYKLEDSNYLDSSGNGLTLTASASAPTLETALFGANANRFTRANSQDLRHAFDSHYNLGGATAGLNRFMIAWCYFVSFPSFEQDFITFRTDSATYPWDWWVEPFSGSGRLHTDYLGNTSSRGITYGTLLSLNTWYLIAFRFSNGTAGLSVNNAAFTNDGVADGMKSFSTGTFEIGCRFDGGTTRANFADARIEHHGGWMSDISGSLSLIWNGGNGQGVY